jgi:hypothetical protein
MDRKTLLSALGLLPLMGVAQRKEEMKIPVDHAIVLPRNTVDVDIVSADGAKRHFRGYNARTISGATYVANQVSGTTAAAAKWIALSSDGTAPAAGDTTIAGEITTGGLARVSASFAVTTTPTLLNGTITYTLTAVYTATLGYTNVQKFGLFNSGPAVGPTLLFATQISPFSGNANDILTITWTVNA